MKKVACPLFISRISVTVAWVLLCCGQAWGISIVSPIEGQVVYQGDKLTVIVKPDAGEIWEEVEIDLAPMSYDSLARQYTAEIGIRKDKLGAISFYVRAYDKAGNETELKRSLFVKMPPNVVLKSIIVDDYKTLFKLPSGSSPEDMQRIESRQLHVDGVYSDGVERDLTSSAAGTTYTSSDEKIVTVDSEGKMRAQAIGSAKITVRNGNYTAEVEVIVKSYIK